MGEESTNIVILAIVVKCTVVDQLYTIFIQ